jgi:hypothetical protein
LQLADRQTFRIAPPGTAFPEEFTSQSVDRDLGDYRDFVIQPSLAVNRYITLTGMLYLYSKDSDSFTGVFAIPDEVTGRGPINLDAAILNAGTASTITRAGLGLRFGDLAGIPRGARRLPIVFSVLYSSTLSTTGYGVPQAPVITLRVSTRWRLFGERPASVGTAARY